MENGNENRSSITLWSNTLENPQPQAVGLEFLTPTACSAHKVLVHVEGDEDARAKLKLEVLAVAGPVRSIRGIEVVLGANDLTEILAGLEADAGERVVLTVGSTQGNISKMWLAFAAKVK